LSDTPSVSVVIPVCNGLAFTRSCLASLAEQRGLEVIVADNGSTDGTWEWLEEAAATRPWLRPLRLASNHGFAGGCNAGLSSARGEFVALLNNDTIAEPKLFGKLVRAWRRYPRIGLIGPRSSYVKGRQVLRLEPGEGVQDVAAIAARLERENGSRAEDVDNLAGLCLLGHREVYAQVGRLDEGYGTGNFEDDDYCLRVRLAGLRLLIAHDSYVHHIGNATFQGLGLDYLAELDDKRQKHEAKWRGHVLFELDALAASGDFTTLADHAAAVPPQDPAFLWSRWHLGRAKLELGATEAAIEPLERFLRACPLHLEAACRLAFARLAIGREHDGRFELARVLRDCALEAHTAASLLTRFAQHCLDQGLETEAADHISTALALAPNFVPAWNTRAFLALRAGQPVAAEACLRPFADSNDPDVLSNLGIALWRQGRATEAIDALRRGCQLGGPNSTAAKNLEQIAGGS
jgi:GT2 family glycosyltransferase/Flp pilus assembly protein TadD